MWRPKNATRHPLPETIWPSRETSTQSLLFSPIQVGRFSLNQRTWIPAMVPWRASSDGCVTPQLIEWYCRFAMGRPGAIVVEATGIRDIPSGPLLRIGHDRYIAGLRQLTDAVRAASDGETKIFIQLIDFLRINRRPTAETYFGRYLDITEHLRTRMVNALQDEVWRTADDALCRKILLGLERPTLEAILSTREIYALDFGLRESVNDMDKPHIAQLPSMLPELFAQASHRAYLAGFDGVELHYAHAYTMASFLSRTNERNDGYGGDPAARLRLPLEVYERCRSQLAHSMVLGCRMLVDEVIPEGSRLHDTQMYARAFAEAGMDFISLSTGGKFDDAVQPKINETVYPYTGPSGFECMPTVYADERGPFLRNVSKMAALRRYLRQNNLLTPIVLAGGIQTFEHAEGILQRDEGDIIGSARQSLADPDWFLKMREGRGHEIRRCAMTNYCEALDNRHKEVTCRLWDRIQLDEPNLSVSADGRRRLTAPIESKKL